MKSDLKRMLSIIGLVFLETMILCISTYFGNTQHKESDCRVLCIICGAICSIFLGGYGLSCVIDKIKLHWLSEEYQSKKPLYICRGNSVWAGDTFVICVGAMLFFLWGSIYNLSSDFLGELGWVLLFAFLLFLGLCVFILRYMFVYTWVVFEDGMAHRNLGGKVHYIPKESVQFVVVGYRDSYIRTAERTFVVSALIKDSYEMLGYMAEMYPSREDYDRLVGKGQEKADGRQICMKEAVDCLLSQTTSYKRDMPILFATNDQNELLFLYFVPNTFFIVKANYENGKLKIGYDFRKKHPLLERFQYRKKGDGVSAALRLRGAEVKFTICPNFSYQGMGCTVEMDQTSIYQEFLQYIDVYREHINEAGEMLNHQNGYLELSKSVRKIKADDKREIWELLEDGNSPEAIRRIQSATGLGIADCKKIADSPYMYL